MSAIKEQLLRFIFCFSASYLSNSDAAGATQHQMLTIGVKEKGKQAWTEELNYLTRETNWKIAVVYFNRIARPHDQSRQQIYYALDKIKDSDRFPFSHSNGIYLLVSPKLQHIWLRRESPAMDSLTTAVLMKNFEPVDKTSWT